LNIAGGTWEGGNGTVHGQVTVSSGQFTLDSYSGMTALAGLLVTGGTITSGTSESFFNGSLTYTSPSSSTFAAEIGDSTSGPSSVTVNNPTANLTISYGNYTGPTTIEAGRLTVNGPISSYSNVEVDSGGTLAGSGTVNGNVTVLGGTVNMTGFIGGTVAASGNTTFNGAASVISAITSTSGTFTLGSGANLWAYGGLNITGGTLAAGNASSTIIGSLDYTSSSNSGFTGVITGTGNTLTLNNASAKLTLTGANTYTGGTTISAGKLYVNNTSGSGTGSGSVTVNNGGTLAGSGTIAPSGGSGVTINAGATLASGGVQSSTTASAGMTLKNTEASSSLLTLNGGSTLSFDLGSTVNNAGSGASNFANPNTNSTYLNITGNTVDQIFSNTTTADNISLVDLTASSPAVTLTLRYSNPYLLIQTALGNNSDFANLVTNNGVGVNGYVYGISDGAGGYTAFNIYSLDTSGTPLADPYQGLQLYLNNGDLEVVPEPSTWAMLLGALGLLVSLRFRGRRALVLTGSVRY
jgi:autotransporter-associated beta strand protein